MLSGESAKLCFSVFFNIILRYIFFQKFDWNSSSLSEGMNFLLLTFELFSSFFLDFFTFICYKKSKWHQHVEDNINNFINLY